jgi:hypothetical protein
MLSEACRVRQDLIMCSVRQVHCDCDSVWYASGVAPGINAHRQLLLLLKYHSPGARSQGGGAYLQANLALEPYHAGECTV